MARLPSLLLLLLLGCDTVTCQKGGGSSRTTPCDALPLSASRVCDESLGFDERIEELPGSTGAFSTSAFTTPKRSTSKYSAGCLPAHTSASRNTPTGGMPLAPEQRRAFFDFKKRAVKHLSIPPRPSPGQTLTPCITFGLGTVPVQLSKKL